MVKEVDILKRYLKTSCTNNDKCKVNVPFLYPCRLVREGMKVVRLGKFIYWVHKIMT